MRELKLEDPCELDLVNDIELELASEDVDAAFAAVTAASQGQIPCSCCNELLDNAEQLHLHQLRNHSVAELSMALVTLRGLDLPFVNADFNVNSTPDDDANNLRDILLESTDRLNECDSESTITVTSESRMAMMSPPFIPNSHSSELHNPMNGSQRSLNHGTSFSSDASCANDHVGSHNSGNSTTTLNDSGFLSLSSDSKKSKKKTISGQKKANDIKGKDPNKQFLCHLCDRRYKKKAHLDRHFRSHTGVRPYECPMCEKRFAVRSILKQHIRVHTGERPFECNICFQRFPQKSGLMTHMMLHYGKPFKCELCEKSFVSNHKLMIHRRSHGVIVGEPPNLGPYSCTSCNMRFFTSGALAAHKKLHVAPNVFTSEIGSSSKAVLITEEAARAAVSAVDKFCDVSFESNLIEVVKDELIIEDGFDDNGTVPHSDFKWDEFGNMCFETQPYNYY